MILPSISAGITNIVSGNGILIVQTSRGALASRDGINWSTVEGIVQSFLGARGNIVFRDGWFSTVTGFSPTRTAYSRDGIIWNLGTAFPSNSFPAPPLVISKDILVTSPPYRSIDGGTNWIPIPELDGPLSHLTSFVVAFGKIFVALPDGRLFTSADTGVTWQESHSFGAQPYGSASRLALQQGRLFWGAAGYWLASSADGENWDTFTGERVLSSRIETLNGLLAAPGATNMVWSADGIAWIASPDSPRNPGRDLIGRDGASLLQADTAGGLWRSNDGMSWQRIMDGRPPEPPLISIDVSKLSPANIGGHTVYAIPSYGFYYSAADGLSWNRGTLNGGPIQGTPQEGKLWTDGSTAFAGVSQSIPIDGANPNELWISHDGADWSQVPSWRYGAVIGMVKSGTQWMALSLAGDVLVTFDNGATWSEDKLPAMKTGIVLTQFAGRCIAFGTEAILSQGGVSIVYSSTDGETWLRNGTIGEPAFGGVRSVASSENALVVLTSAGTLYTASDSNLTWINTGSVYPVPARVTQVAGIFSLENKLISTDGTTWQTPTANGSSVLTPSYFFAGKYISFPYYVGPHWSLDGKNWTKMSGGDVTLGYSPMISQGDNFLRARDSKGAIWETTDGTSWLRIADSPSAPTNTSQGTQNAKFKSRLMVGGTSGLMLSSSNDGATWEPSLIDGKAFPSGMEIRKLLATDTEAIAIHTVNGNTFPPVLRYFRTTDGLNWTENTELAALKLVNMVPSGNRWIGLLAYGGLVESTDGALTWNSIGTIPNIVYAYEISIFNGLWVAACSNNTSGNSLAIHTCSDGQTWTLRNTTKYSTSSGASFSTAHGQLYFGVGPDSVRSADGITWSVFDKVSSSTAPGGQGVKTMIPVGDGFLGFNSSGDNSYFWTAPATGGAWTMITPYQNQINGIGTPDSSRIFLFGNGIIKELVQTDLAISFPDPAAVDYGVGDKINLNVTLRNLGAALLPGLDSLPFEAWLTPDGFFGDGNDVFIGKISVPATPPALGNEITMEVPFILPNDISPGKQRVVLKLATEGLLSESNRANNVFMSAGAAIVIPQWEFSVATIGNGQVNRDFAATRYPNKAQISLTATAGKGATFSGWGGDAFSPNNQITILMDGNKSVLANFSNRANLQLFVRGLGSVSGATDLGNYPVNSTASLAAIPAPGWEFSHWSGASTAATPATTVLMDSQKILTANFVQNLSAWKDSHFTAAELLDPKISGNDADPDGDGVKNWQEHLHGADPKDKTSNGVVSTTLDGNFLRCIYTRHTGPGTGASLECQAGRTMNDWDAPDLQERILFEENGIETIEAMLPRTGNTRGFIRFKYLPETP